MSLSSQVKFKGNANPVKVLLPPTSVYNLRGAATEGNFRFCFGNTYRGTGGNVFIPVSKSAIFVALRYSSSIFFGVTDLAKET